jgi:hypothetical protein
LPWHVIGLDLGQAQDFTALALLEAQTGPGGRTYYAVRHLERWQLGTKYSKIVADLAALVISPPLARPLLAVDGTGVGRAVVDLFRSARLPAVLMGVTITAGHHVAVDDPGWLSVPKKELVGTLQLLLQSRRLAIASGPLAHTLAAELATFRIKVTASAQETVDAWRERDHDDLVLAVALAAWLAEEAGPPSAHEPDERPAVIRVR